MKLLKHKKGNTIMWFIILLIMLYAISTQKVEINSKQITVASEQSCKLLNKIYDPVNKICLPLNSIGYTLPNQSNGV